ncbi:MULTISPECIES: DUF6988 family protein [unclassified Variovorax]|uniref:DUF6988 family protein n=1 Tax=unclassified Variovorax TaxID=663243 RepID=UPI002B225753|nr:MULTISPECIES: hypothetical protein [unclassified Variovorax]MEB0114535.1 hypothetical protein [Variovorax sp. RTB1]
MLSFPVQSDQLVERALERSGQLHEAMSEILALACDDVVLLNLMGTNVGLASAGLSMEHGDSVLTLVARGNPNTATAILRMQFESMLRGAWAIYAATEQEIEALEREITIEADVQARQLASYSKMFKALRKEDCSVPHALLDELSRVDDVLRHGLNSFIHGGFQPLKHQSDGFPLHLMLQVIETSNAISTMTSALFAVLVDDGGMRMARLNAMLIEFRDVLPEMTIVLQK